MTNPEQTWNADLYQDSHSFVWQYGTALLDLLQPQPGERILDLGCGTGQLTAAIAATGATVIGLDADPAMVAEAQAHYPQLDFRVGDACRFELESPVDAVFSNATFHWIQDQDRLVAAVARSLQPGGRLVAEFGGKGCVQAILDGLQIVRTNLGYGVPSVGQWYFPSIGEYAPLLERYGFEVTFAALFDRPTPLQGETGLANWIGMFAGRYLGDLPPEEQLTVLRGVEAWLRPSMYRQGQWLADYRRLRITATRQQLV